MHHFQWKRKRTHPTRNHMTSRVFTRRRPCRCLCSRMLKRGQLTRMPDKCDIFVFSVVKTCHQRWIPSFLESFETVKHFSLWLIRLTPAQQEVSGQLITSDLYDARSGLNNKRDISTPWVYVIRVFNTETSLSKRWYLGAREKALEAPPLRSGYSSTVGAVSLRLPRC